MNFDQLIRDRFAPRVDLTGSSTSVMVTLELIIPKMSSRAARRISTEFQDQPELTQSHSDKLIVKDWVLGFGAP